MSRKHTREKGKESALRCGRRPDCLFFTANFLFGKGSVWCFDYVLPSCLVCFLSLPLGRVPAFFVSRRKLPPRTGRSIAEGEGALFSFFQVVPGDTLPFHALFRLDVESPSSRHSHNVLVRVFFLREAIAWSLPWSTKDLLKEPTRRRKRAPPAPLSFRTSAPYFYLFCPTYDIVRHSDMVYRCGTHERTAGTACPSSLPPTR